MTSNRNQALGAIEQAVQNGRLSHALLLQGRDASALKAAACQIASWLLKCPEEKVLNHPDFMVLQARNKMRQISVDNTRELIRQIQHSPNAGDRKVAVVLEVDRMNQESANAFLKTLEEPPLNTNIILTTAKPNALLDTILSRCLAFWFNQPEQPIENPLWLKWKSRFASWLSDISKPPQARSDISGRMMQLYGLIDGFQFALDALTADLWEQEKLLISENTPEEELIAIEVGLSKRIRARLLADIEHEVRSYALEKIKSAESRTVDPSLQYEQCVSELESMVGLLELNLSNTKMLEVYFLKILRIWSPSN